MEEDTSRMINDKMGIKRLDHVCWAVEHVDDVLPLLTDLMGMTVEGRFENPEIGFRGVGLRVPGAPAISSYSSPPARTATSTASSRTAARGYTTSPSRSKMPTAPPPPSRTSASSRS